MTTVYENMKPAEAARIFERMDVTFASGLLVAHAARNRGPGAEQHEPRHRLCADLDHRQPQLPRPDQIGRFEGLLISPDQEGG